MSREADNPHYVRRVVLPSGKTIEVVYFDEIPAFPAVGDSGYTESAEDLHVCGSCASDLVYPVDWDEAGATLTWIGIPNNPERRTVTSTCTTIAPPDK